MKFVYGGELIFTADKFVLVIAINYFAKYRNISVGNILPQIL